LHRIGPWYAYCFDRNLMSASQANELDSAKSPTFQNRATEPLTFSEVLFPVMFGASTRYATLSALLFSAFCVFKPYANAQGGIPLWTNHNAVGGLLALDGAGNVLVSGRNYESVAKYSNSGSWLWTTGYGLSASASAAMTVDSNGDVIIISYPYSGLTSSDFATVKFSSAGGPLWAQQYGGSGFSEDRPYGVAVDGDRNIFVTGYSTRGTNHNDCVTIKYSPDGVGQWTNFFSGTGNTDDYGTAVAVDSGGKVFVTGYLATGQGAGAYVTLAYSGAGVPIWTNIYPAPGGEAFANAIAVDAIGNVFVTGNSAGIGSGYDYATLKYSNAGVPLWTNRYNGPGNGDDVATAITVDNAGNVLVFGRSAPPNGYHDYALLKYSTGGVPLWTNRYNGPMNRYDYGMSVALDQTGNAFVSGYVSGGAGSTINLATLAYSSSGLPLWTNIYPSSLSSFGDPAGLAVDNAGNVFVTSRDGPIGGFVLIKYSSSVRAFLSAQRLNDNLVLAWTNASFNLQAAPVAMGGFTNIPGATSPYTNSAQGSQCFFRLIAN
jgi:hypothetical protein